jgi:glycogen debranching enzyme
MVKVIHYFEDIIIEKEVADPVSFILTNNKGGYTYFSENPESRYQGFFFFDDFKMYKVIENIRLMGNIPITGIKNNFFDMEIKRDDIVESFFMPCNFNSLVYTLDKESEIQLTLDVKESYDSRIWGRYYEIFEDKGCVIVKFTKRTDDKEDSSRGFEEYVVYIAIRSDSPGFKKVERWAERYYRLDEERNSFPCRRYVFEALELKGKKFVFSVSKNKEEAIKECSYVFENVAELKKIQQKRFYRNIILNGNKENIKKIISNEKKFAYISALHSLYSMVISNEENCEMLAGLPWFFQSWSRDTAISSTNLNINIRKIILFGVLNTIQKSGRVSNVYNNYARTALDNTADATGWIFYRIYELYKENKLTRDEISIVKNKLIQSLELSELRITGDGFETNGDLETWMDTSADSDTRAGIRIEIQALRLAMYRFAYELTKSRGYKNKEQALKNKVRGSFWNGSILADGLNDFTIRPNIFVAAYVYPDMLKKEEWAKCFENTLSSLWLDWGGLSTIDRKNYLFCNEHTGENNKSYHRGDSWFWINNLAAISLYRLDKNKFAKYINGILGASTEEILWKSAVSHHSELSSASKLTGQGCLMQSWSNAMYIELINSIYTK